MKLDKLFTWRKLLLTAFMAASLLSGLVQLPISLAASSAANEESSKAHKLEPLSLNDVQDAGLLLNLIQSQCINIYQEASRAPVSLESSPEIKFPSKIPTTLPNANFLPPRQEWLIFFVGTIEPIVKQFAAMVRESDSGVRTVVIPDAMRTTVEPLVTEWSRDTKVLNHHLDVLVSLFDDAPKQGVQIRELAVACYEDANRMEKVRRKIFHILQESAFHGQGKIMVTPLGKINGDKK